MIKFEFKGVFKKFLKDQKGKKFGSIGWENYKNVKVC